MKLPEIYMAYEGGKRKLQDPRTSAHTSRIFVCLCNSMPILKRLKRKNENHKERKLSFYLFIFS